MAQVTQNVETSIDWLLDYLDERWRGVAEIAQVWDSWDPTDQEVWVLEWAIPRSRLLQLQEYAARHELRPSQRTRYVALQHLMAQTRPTLDRLLES